MHEKQPAILPKASSLRMKKFINDITLKQIQRNLKRKVSLVAIHKSLHGKSPSLLPAISDSIEKIVARKKKKI
jgi:hypothetical protein